MNPKTFFAELKRRNVYKVAIAYGVVAWLLMQIASQIFPFFEIPNWAVRLVMLLLIIGFPVALILTWAFELTPEGIKRAEDVDLTKSTTRRTSHKLFWRKLSRVFAVNPNGKLLVRVTGLLLFDSFHFVHKPLKRDNNWEIHPVLKMEYCPEGETCRAESDANWRDLEE